MTRKGEKNSLGDPVEKACRLNDEAVAAYARGEADRAASLFGRALRPLEEAEDEDSPDIANVLSSLAALHEGLCRYAEAEESYRRAADIMDKLDPAEDDEDLRQLRLQTLSNLGRINRIRGRYERDEGRHAEAEELLKRGLATFERALADDHPSLVACRENYERQPRRTGGESSR